MNNPHKKNLPALSEGFSCFLIRDIVEYLDVSIRISFMQYSPCSFYRATLDQKEVQSMSRKYEILYIIRPDISEDDKNALVERFDTLLKDQGAEVIESKDWEKKRLAYDIKDYTEGLYHLVELNADNADALNEFDRLARINRDILRHMIVQIDN